MNASSLALIRAAFLRYGVLVFRRQSLDSQAFLSFASHLGEPIEYPFVKGLDAFPQIIEVKKLPHERVNFGGIWHSDTTYLAEPPKATLLLARQIPEVGGDTLFACQHQAYRGLSEGLRKVLHGLSAISSSAKADVSKTREDRLRDAGKDQGRTTLEATHPVVRRHPETGQPVLYVNMAHTARFDNWSEEESASLLQCLHRHQVRPEYCCRVRWEEGSLTLWDNRRVLHYPVNDYHGHLRLMHRITLAGEKPSPYANP
jgi:taurine dioxygenase